MKKVMILIVTVFVAMTTAAQDAKQLQLTQEWDKTFPKSEKVNHKKVVFHNRYNITLIGDLYTPKNAQGKLPAIAFCGPYGAVKEQSSGKYAQRIAEAGFITLAFDPSFNGESGGEPRHLTSPEIFTEDFSAAVDFLSVQDFVDADHIGIMGICAFGSFALNAAQIDTRIKATATSTMWRLDGMLMGDRKQQLDAWNAQRTEDYRNGTYAIQPALPDEPFPGWDRYDSVWGFYRTKERGYHPRSFNSVGGQTVTSNLPFVNVVVMKDLEQIENAVLLVVGEKGMNRPWSEEAYKRMKGDNKFLNIVPGAKHEDLYDDYNHNVPWSDIETFFNKYLK